MIVLKWYNLPDDAVTEELKLRRLLSSVLRERLLHNDEVIRELELKKGDLHGSSTDC